jgi:hypothetical protein
MFVVELLTLRTWLLAVLPRLVWRRVRGRAVTRCEVIDASPLALRVAQVTARPFGVAVTVLRFRMIDVREPDGLLIRLTAFYRDMDAVQADVVADPAFQLFLSRCGTADRLSAAVIKTVAAISLTDRTTLWRVMLLARLVEWLGRDQPAGERVLVAERRPWGRAVVRYAATYGVALIEVPVTLDLRTAVQRTLGPRVLGALRAARDVFAHRRIVGAAGTPREDVASPDADRRSRLAVSYHGQFSINDPSRYSDLFFWQESELSGRDLLMLFEFPQDPLDREKWLQLREHGIDAIALYPGATTVPDVRLHTHVAGLRGSGRERAADGVARPDEVRWLKRAIASHETTRDYWQTLFARENVKMYFTWYRYDAKHYAIADALQALGGVTAIYQRAHQPDPAPEISVHADLMFGYAPADAEVERRSGSVIPYHVAVGYFGDHRFTPLKPAAAEVRARLQAHGAKYIVAFFDENSADDERWHTGHQFMRDNYAFVLERLLADPTLGLVLKPKYPSSLRKRLGPVAPSLVQAEATGRCFVFEEGPLHGALPPAVAALASDLAIHGHLVGSTAGLEAALAGVPTLLLDREGWACSPMYGLGVGRVVFTDWPELWRGVTAHRAHPEAMREFGDWSLMMDSFDPFRDGRGAERVGTYLDWVLKSLHAGAGRDVALADAAERYVATWGRDKIRSVNAGAGPWTVQ